MSLNILVIDDSETVRPVIHKTLDLACVLVKETHEASTGKSDTLKKEKIARK